MYSLIFAPDTPDRFSITTKNDDEIFVIKSSVCLLSGNIFVFLFIVIVFNT